MAFYKSKNPALGANTFNNLSRVGDSTETMTISGTINKITILGLIVFICAMLTWNFYASGQNVALIQPILIGGFVLGFISAIVIVIKKSLSPYLAPLYCAFEGLALGGLSAILNDAFPGIVLQAITLTFGILFGLLLLYRMNVIRASKKFKMIVGAATMGIALSYLVSFAGSFIGFHVPFIHDSSTGGIIFSLAVVVIASLNLVVDFDFIEKGAESNAPKYMESYGAFGLMVTLIWLYIEILRLLSKLRRR